MVQGSEFITDKRLARASCPHALRIANSGPAPEHRDVMLDTTSDKCMRRSGDGGREAGSGPGLHGITLTRPRIPFVRAAMKSASYEQVREFRIDLTSAPDPQCAKTHAGHLPGQTSACILHIQARLQMTLPITFVDTKAWRPPRYRGMVIVA
jgi:hypothetical protein